MYSYRMQQLLPLKADMGAGRGRREKEEMSCLVAATLLLERIADESQKGKLASVYIYNCAFALVMGKKSQAWGQKDF